MLPSSFTASGERVFNGPLWASKVQPLMTKSALCLALPSLTFPLLTVGRNRLWVFARICATLCENWGKFYRKTDEETSLTAPGQQHCAQKKEHGHRSVVQGCIWPWHQKVAVVPVAQCEERRQGIDFHIDAFVCVTSSLALFNESPLYRI